MQYKPLENFMNYDSKMDGNIEKVLLFTTWLVEKERIIEIMKKYWSKRMKNSLYSMKIKMFMLIERDMSPEK